MRKRTRHIISPQGDKGDNTRSEELITVILLSEKAGRRMKSYGPTPLIRLGDSTLLDKQIEAIRSVFINYEIIICAGFDCDRVVKYVRDKYARMPIRIVENQIHHHSNCCESSRLCLNNTTNSKVLLCNGSLLFDSRVLSLAMNDGSYVISECEESKFSNLEVGMTIGENGHTNNFCYGLDNIWSEIVFLDGEPIIETFRKIVSSVDYKNRFVFEALNNLNKTKHKLKVVSNDQAPVIKINNIKTYHEVRKNYAGANTKLRNP
jgi:choline kinase